MENTNLPNTTKTGNTRYEIFTPDGFKPFHGVRKSAAKGGATICFDSGAILNCTLNHLLKTEIGMMPARLIKEGDKVLANPGTVIVTHVFLDNHISGTYYDALEVGEKHLYYTNGVLSHNCAFLGSSGTLISGETLKRLVVTDTTALHSSDGLNTYIKPIEDHIYVIIADVSRGRGLDYSAFHVFDITKLPYEQVCTYRNNLILPPDYANIIYSVSKHYNGAYVLVELNDIGGQVADLLQYDYEIDTLLFTESAGRAGKRISAGFTSNKVEKGIRTTSVVKAMGCSMLKLLIEQDKISLHDHETIKELTTFSRKANSYAAEVGCHDDLVMGLVLFAWFTTQKFFKEITDINIMMALREKTEQQMQDDLMPFGFTYDDLEDASPITEYHEPNYYRW